jgi:hypothetical protein
VHVLGRVAIGIGRVAMIAVILAQLVTAVWIRLPTSTLDRLLTDLRMDRVAELQIQDDEDFAGRVLGQGIADVDEAIRVRWRTTDGSWHTFLTRNQPEFIAGTDLPPESPDAESDDGSGPDQQDGRTVEFGDGRYTNDPVVGLIVDALERVPVDRELPLGHWTDGGLSFVAALTWLVVLFTLVRGPQPRGATKWAWFWLLSLPLGLGPLALLVSEAPWSRRASLRPEPLPHDQQRHTPDGDSRLTGGYALVLGAMTGAFLVGWPSPGSLVCSVRTRRQRGG